jgi:hypothetical protein
MSGPRRVVEERIEEPRVLDDPHRVPLHQPPMSERRHRPHQLLPAEPGRHVEMHVLPPGARPEHEEGDSGEDECDGEEQTFE